jgi:hypothetical protein
MAKNRKNQSGAVRFVPALKAILLCTLIGGSAVGYVLQKNQLHDLGRQITRREIALERLKRENNLRAAQLSNMQMPQRLIERVREQKLGLFPSQPAQCIFLFETSPTVEKTNRVSSFLLSGK